MKDCFTLRAIASTCAFLEKEGWMMMIGDDKRLHVSYAIIGLVSYSQGYGQARRRVKLSSAQGVAAAFCYVLRGGLS